jgi:hypothetical protein
MDMKILILVICCELALCTHLVEYKFGLNYGQVFNDYSNYTRHAVNGASYLNTTYDTIATDRGAFFSDRRSTITLPANDYMPSGFLLPSNFSISIWLYVTDQDTVFLRYKNNTNYFSIQKNGLYINFTYYIQGINYASNTLTNFSSSDL